MTCYDLIERLRTDESALVASVLFLVFVVGWLWRATRARADS